MGLVRDRGRETGKYDRFLDQHALGHALVALASGQHCVLGLTQLVELGLTPAAVHKRAAAGRLHRIHQGVYALVPLKLLTREGRWMAAVLACGPGAVLSHRSAAMLHELRRTDRAKIDVTVPARSIRRHAGIDVHRSTTLTPADITIVRGIPCTNVARTLIDLAAVLARRPVERVLDQAEIAGVLNLRALEHQLQRNPRHRGGPRLRSILEEHYIGRTPTASELEEAFLMLCRNAGVPDPEVNQWIDLNDGELPILADFVWRKQRVIIETDGRRVHGTRQARERDPRRDQRAIMAGCRPIRTTWRQVMRRPHELQPMLKALLQL